jgi:hypothetical protein
MKFDEILKFKLKRVNPFQGLVIDSDTWRDAHEYHRNQQRLHMLAFHNIGIIEGLKIVANKPPELSVSIFPGIAVDPEGNVIIVSETQNYRIQTRDKRTIYLIIQFREVPAEPYQPPEGGQPTRIIEAYRIQERDKLPNESYLELCRINFDPADKAIRDAKNPSAIGKNEIDLSFRQETTELSKPPAEQITIQNKGVAQTKQSISSTEKSLAIGHTVLGEASRNLHSVGLQNLIKEINRQSGYASDLSKNVVLDKNINRLTLLYVTGNSRFELPAEQQSALSDFLQSGGVIFGEGCNDESQGTPSKGSKEFGLAFNQLANQFKCKLEVVQRGHSLLSAYHVFSEVPQGVETAMLLEGGRMIYSGSDYGCAYQGGHQGKPLSRDNIRDSLEIGTNIVAYAQMMKVTRR